MNELKLLTKLTGDGQKMDKSTYEQKREDIKEKVKQQQEIMKSDKNVFLEDTTNFVSTFYEEELNKYIKSVANKEITIKLGAEGRNRLISEYKELIENIPEMIKDKLDKNDIWSHNWTLDKLIEKSHSHIAANYAFKELNGIIDKPIKEILGYLGELLSRYGYLEGKRSNWKKNDDGTYIYGYRIDCSPEMKNSINKYLKSDAQLARLISKLNDLEHQKESEEIEDLWDQL